ncbi:hypothetical protein QJS10_CPB19g00527 [Acorus calamus]|uniref:Uncharacterized protein n=1 Tax=Acorus calamus TaxID=4465 RepID=A0AAV9CI20_ACOCL|nr:hypothetical protein QJS10_CPB19g00527 [Acorus calamus]
MPERPATVGRWPEVPTDHDGRSGQMGPDPDSPGGPRYNNKTIAPKIKKYGISSTPNLAGVVDVQVPLIGEMENLLDVAETLVVVEEERVTRSLLELPFGCLQGTSSLL